MRKHLIVGLALTLFAATGVAYGAGKSASAPRGGMPANSQAAANSNGIRSLDRDKGLDRAEDRRNANSLKSNKGRAKKAARSIPR